jgi:hypothetical protein
MLRATTLNNLKIDTLRLAVYRALKNDDKDSKEYLRNAMQLASEYNKDEIPLSQISLELRPVLFYLLENKIYCNSENDILKNIYILRDKLSVPA